VTLEIGWMEITKSDAVFLFFVPITFENSFWHPHHRCRLRGIAALGGNDSNFLLQLSWSGAHGGNENVES